MTKGDGILKASRTAIVIFLALTSVFFAGVRTTDISMSFSGTLEGTVTVPYIYGIENWPTQKYINNTIMDDLQDFLRQLVSSADTDYESFKAEGWPFRQYQVYVSYDNHYSDDSLLSFTIDYYQYTGGDHGITYKYPYNYNLRTGEDLSLGDIFLQAFDYSSLILSEINQKILENPEWFFEPSVDYLQPGTKFYLTGEDLVVYYGHYEIGPYAIGMPEFHIPLTLLKEGLADFFDGLTESL